MKYNITDMNIEVNNNTCGVYSYGSKMRIPTTPTITVNLSLEVYEHQREELQSIENIQKALKDEDKIDELAPSYMELIEKYHPEFLL